MNYADYYGGGQSGGMFAPGYEGDMNADAFPIWRESADPPWQKRRRQPYGYQQPQTPYQPHPSQPIPYNPYSMMPGGGQSWRGGGSWPGRQGPYQGGHKYGGGGGGYSGGRYGGYEDTGPRPQPGYHPPWGYGGGNPQSRATTGPVSWRGGGGWGYPQQRRYQQRKKHAGQQGGVMPYDPGQGGNVTYGGRQPYQQYQNPAYGY